MRELDKMILLLALIIVWMTMPTSAYAGWISEDYDGGCLASVTGTAYGNSTTFSYNNMFSGTATGPFPMHLSYFLVASSNPIGRRTAEDPVVRVIVDGNTYDPEIAVRNFGVIKGWHSIGFFLGYLSKLREAIIKGDQIVVSVDGYNYAFSLRGSKAAINRCTPIPADVISKIRANALNLTRLKNENGLVIYSLHGVIDYAAAERLTRRLRKLPHYGLVYLNSAGGSVTAALLLGEALRESGAQTAIYSDDICASSCTLIFASGSNRIIWRGAKLGFHNFTTGSDTLDTRLDVMQAVLPRIKKLFDNREINSKLIEIIQSTPAYQLYWMTPSEARRLNAATVYIE